MKRTVLLGEILRDELKEMGVSPTAFARQINVPPTRISQNIAGKRSVIGDTALRFGHWFETYPLLGSICRHSSILPRPTVRLTRQFVPCR